MADEQDRLPKWRPIRDPLTGKVVVRVNEEERLLQVLPYRRRPVYIPLDEIVPKEP